MFRFRWLTGVWLGQRVALYVPGTRNVHMLLSPEEHQEAVRDVAAFLSGLFGGATALPGQGFWLAREDGTLVVEPTTLVYAYARRVSRNQRQAVLEYAASLRQRYGQDAIAVEIYGKLRFV